MQPEVILVLGVGIAIAIFALVRERFEAPWADRSLLSDAPDEVDVMGRTIYVEHVRETRHRGSGPPRTAYGVALPTALAGVGLIDPEGRRRFGETTGYGVIETSGHPDTSDGLFDSTFLVTENHRNDGGLEHAEVRAALLEVRETCQGVWVRDGRMYIIESGPYSESAAEVTGEYFAGVLERMEAALDA